MKKEKSVQGNYAEGWEPKCRANELDTAWRAGGVIWWKFWEWETDDEEHYA
jgi:hypothetical protein